ncbi:MAG: hypothetical protein JSS66_06190 [Armatimonadetes bacterium]|nr:hypothetical protein [Armatimonadota bacterium]
MRFSHNLETWIPLLSRLPYRVRPIDCPDLFGGILKVTTIARGPGTELTAHQKRLLRLYGWSYAETVLLQGQTEQATDVSKFKEHFANLAIWSLSPKHAWFLESVTLSEEPFVYLRFHGFEAGALCPPSLLDAVCCH